MLYENIVRGMYLAVPVVTGLMVYLFFIHRILHQHITGRFQHLIVTANNAHPNEYAHRLTEKQVKEDP